jgi:molybdate transport system substrate-binding protein
MKRLVAVATAAVVIAGGCSSGSAGPDPKALTVFAASSLTEVFPRLNEKPRYQFAGSDDLALQLREGAHADVFAAASPKYPTELFEAGVVEQPIVFATNRLVLIVPKDDPAAIHSVDDLRRPGIKLVIGAQGVPVGDYTREILATLGATDVLDQVVSEEQDVKGVVGKVSLGEADAGFVYATDVLPVESDVTSLELPDAAQPTVEYMVAIVAESEAKAAAGDFIELLLGPRGRAALADAGFGLP